MTKQGFKDFLTFVGFVGAFFHLLVYNMKVVNNPNYFKEMSWKMALFITLKNIYHYYVMFKNFKKLKAM